MIDTSRFLVVFVAAKMATLASLQYLFETLDLASVWEIWCETNEDKKKRLFLLDCIFVLSAEPHKSFVLRAKKVFQSYVIRFEFEMLYFIRLYKENDGSKSVSNPLFL